MPPAGNEAAKELAACFLRVSRLGYGTFDLLHRYETALWRQAAQILFCCGPPTPRQRADRQRLPQLEATIGFVSKFELNALRRIDR